MKLKRHRLQWAEQGGKVIPIRKIQPRNLKGTEQDVGVVHEEASDGRCMEWEIWDAGK